MDRIYWQNLEFELCGWVESELALEVLLLMPEVEAPVPEQTYQLRVLEGFSIVSPEPKNLIDNRSREMLFNQANTVLQKASLLKAVFQNPGVDFDDRMLSQLRSTREEVYKLTTNLIQAASRAAKETK